MATNSDEGRNAYNEFIAKACRHMTHILEDLPSCKPAIDHLLELLPRLQPRFYSISSSSKVHKDFVHVTAVVIGKLFHSTVWKFNTFSTIQFLREINAFLFSSEYETSTGRTNNGVCTKWLQPMKPDDNANYRVPIYVRRSQFRLPNRVQTPVIMIGPGTGLAPFRYCHIFGTNYP